MASNQVHSLNRTNNNRFSSIGRGFQAQRSQNSNMIGSQQHRFPPPGESRMTAEELAKICWWIPKQRNQNNDIPQALAALTLDNSVVDTEWMADTGASNHMTGERSLLGSLKGYNETDSIMIGDGTALPIIGVGKTTINQENVLHLDDVLLVPDLKRNLSFICEFTNVDFPVKERKTGHLLVTEK